MRDLILRTVEAADGWMFIPTNQLVKAPGLTEPFSVSRMSPIAVSGLADQLIFQVDQSDDYTFHSDKNGRCTVTNENPKPDGPTSASWHGESRAINALRAIAGSGFIK